MTTKIRLIAMPEETGFAPLGVLGYCLSRTNFLAPVFTDLVLPIKKKVEHSPQDKLMDVLVSILTGCRAMYQVNLRLCPDLALARAWGRPHFASQANLARTLDSFNETSIGQLRQGSERLFRRESRSLSHNFAQDWLWLDIDLTALPISKHAQASAKGKINGKKTVMGGSWLGSTRRSTRKRCSPGCIPANNTAARLTSPSCKLWPNS
jgi:hypothetical protein